MQWAVEMYRCRCRWISHEAQLCALKWFAEQEKVLEQRMSQSLNLAPASVDWGGRRRMAAEGALVAVVVAMALAISAEVAIEADAVVDNVEAVRVIVLGQFLGASNSK